MFHAVCLFTGIRLLSLPSEPTEELSLKDKYEGTSTLSLFPIVDICSLVHCSSKLILFQSTASLTLDPSTAHGSLKVSKDCKSVSFEKSNGRPNSKFPHVMSKEELGSGQYYWEVMVWNKEIFQKPKSSWCVGVTQKPHSENVLRALCYEAGTGLYPNTHDYSKISTEYNMTKLGLHLNCERNSLSFYNADKSSENHLHTFYNIPRSTYFALFSPGVKDGNPVKILK